MKSLNLALIVSSATLLASTLVQAEVSHQQSAHQQNFISKRPYHQPVVERATPQANDFEGATLVRDEISDADIAAQKQQQVMRLNQLSRRAF
jgi:hypothetical protein